VLFKHFIVLFQNISEKTLIRRFEVAHVIEYQKIFPSFLENTLKDFLFLIRERQKYALQYSKCSKPQTQQATQMQRRPIDPPHEPPQTCHYKPFIHKNRESGLLLSCTLASIF
jgi:hypothetical protein